MSFGENLQYLRKQAGMTQEDLADRMGVSRQTVSKWESDGAFPEMEKLFVICDLYQIDLDTLLRGSAEQARAVDIQDYDGHMNHFTWQIMVGVWLILLGVTLVPLLTAFGIPEGLAGVVFFLFLIAAVTILIVAGIGHGSFVEENPTVSFTYDEETVRAFRRQFPILIAVPTAMILAGVTILVAFAAILDLVPFLPTGLAGNLGIAFLLLMVTMAVPVYIYAGLQNEKYNTLRYNREHDRHPVTQESRQTRRAGTIDSAIMSGAVIVFLLLGFVWNLWHPGWIVFPICGIACGIVNRAMGVDD